MKEFIVYLYIALLGGFGYCTLEIITRGRTHYSMFFAGAVVLVSFYYISKYMELSFITECILGAVIITSVELVLGIWFNVYLKAGVWDYSSVPLNFMGQICLPYSLLWLLISAAVFKLLEKVPPISQMNIFIRA